MKAAEFGEITRNNGYYAVQDHSRSPILVPIESPYATTNEKSHMSFRLVPNSVTLNDLERRNSSQVCFITPNSVAFGTHYVKVVEDTPILSAAEM